MPNGEKNGKTGESFAERMRRLRIEEQKKEAAQEAESAVTNRTPPNPDSNRQRNREELSKAIAQASEVDKNSETDTTTPEPIIEETPRQIFEGEWFADSTISSPLDATPMEQAQIEKIREEAMRRVQELAGDRAAVDVLISEAQQVAESLPSSFVAQSRSMARVVEKAATDLKNISPDQKEILVNEALAAIAAGKPLTDLIGHNPIAQTLLAENQLQGFERRGSVSSKARERDITLPNTSAYWASGTTALAAALVGFGLEVGTTKTAVIQLNDIYNIPGIRDGIAFIADALRNRGWSPEDALATAKITVGGSAAAAVGLTLVGTKSIGPKNMGVVGKSAFYGSLGLSLGLGYLALQNFVADTRAVSNTGTIASQEFGKIANEARTIKGEREKLFAEVAQIIEKAVRDEENRPGAAGYGQYTAFIAKGLTGNFNKEAFDKFTAGKGTPDHAALQKVIEDLQKKYFGDGNTSKGLSQLLPELTAKVDLETAPKLSDAVEKVGKAAANTRLWSGLGKVLTPWANIPTSTGIYNEAKEAADAFGRMIGDDARIIAMARGQITDYLDTMIKASAKNPAMVKSLQDLKNTLLRKLNPIQVAPTVAQDAFNKIPKPTGRWVIWPDDVIWSQMQETLKGTAFESMGMDVATPSSARPFWRAGLITLLGGFFLLINGGSYILSKRLNKKREEAFEGELTEGTEQLNERESFLAAAVGAAIEKAHRQFILHSGATSLSYPVPPSLIELHVRKHLRTSYLEKTDGKLSLPQRMGWFVHGLALGKTPQDIRLFTDYNDWLEQKLKAFDTDPAKEMQDIVHSLYPDFEKTVDANDATIAAITPEDRRKAEKRLESDLRKLRTAQLKEYASLIEERLAVLAVVPTDSPEIANPEETQVRLDLEGTNIIVSREAALSAFAHRHITGERQQLEETREYLRRIGITSSATVEETADDLKIGGFSIGPRSAIEDQLRRIRAAREIGMPSTQGKAEDFERFDQYMTEVAHALRSVRDTILKNDPQLQGYQPDFVWRKTDGGHYTIQIDLYSDPNRVGTPVSSITYTKPVPDFDPNMTPQKTVEEISNWLIAGGPAIQGLIAQERHSHYQAEFARLLAEIRKMGGGKPEIQLIDRGRSQAPSPENLATLTKAYQISELLDEQAGSVSLARRALPIEPGKFRAFIVPEEYMSDKRTGVELSGYIEDLLKRDFPDDVRVRYNAGLKTFNVTRVSGGFLGRKTTESESKAIPVKQYSANAIEEAVREISIEE